MVYIPDQCFLFRSFNWVFVFIEVVLVAAIVSKTGKVILSRQFCSIQRTRVEGLLHTFPKLITSNLEHTTVENDNVRYIYQPIDTLFMVLITNRQSNIVQDLASLKLFAGVVVELSKNCHEHSILNKTFEILMAFDEIITEGYTEHMNMGHIRNNLAMESSEERKQEIIAMNKEREAKEELKRRAKQFEVQRKEAARRGEQFMQGHYNETISSRSSIRQTMISKAEDRIPTRTMPITKGMKLGSKGKVSQLLHAIQPDLEEPLQESSDKIHVNIEEKLSAIISKNGDMDKLETKGTLLLRVSNPSSGHIKFIVDTHTHSGIQFKTHPNIDKEAFKYEKSVQMKDPSKSFPLHHDLEILRWKYVTKDETELPLSVTCWPSLSGDSLCNVNVAYDLELEQMELHDVILSIPIPVNTSVDVTHYEGRFCVDTHRHVLEWTIPVINRQNSSGTLECSVICDDVNSFFPLTVSFNSNKIITEVDVTDILNLATNTFVEFHKKTHLSTDKYLVGPE